MNTQVPVTTFDKAKMVNHFFNWLIHSKVIPGLIEANESKLASKFESVTVESNPVDYYYDLTLDLALALALALDLDLDLDRALDRARDLARAYVDALIAAYIYAGGNVESIHIPMVDTAVLTAIRMNGNKLEMSDFHLCSTTHCRFGWMDMIAPGGMELESAVGAWWAGAMIYRVSKPDSEIPDAYCSNEEAMEDIEARAALETAA